jgi:hypothetical protein
MRICNNCLENNAELRRALNSVDANDSIRREEFSKLLDNYKLSNNQFS